MVGRRDFLRTLSGAALGALASRCGSESTASGARRLDRIGLQLYTVRSRMATDFQGTLDRVAEIGYREVEFAGYFEHDPAEVKSALANAGLKAPAAHVPLELVRDDMPRLLDAATTIGHRWLVVAWIPEEERSADGYRSVVDTFNHAGEEAWAAGLRFAYHNHDFEFADLEGRPAYDFLLEMSDPERVEFELDLYWITHGGRDPLDYFERYPGRFPLVHVKDSAGPPQHRMVEVGAGVIDFAKIFARSERAGMQHYFVEHDNPQDPLASIAASYDYLSNLSF